MSAALRPLPLPDLDTAPFWTAAARGELSMQSCAVCRGLRFPPRPMCPRCGSLESFWKPVSGRGTVWSYVVCHPP
ncbi:MAG TPA: zinc ribbon domain-containing protein, partial [Myxococcota bacterium]|nr:zinc ribbon domain-containing protein [Myxococcota bacterium]